MFAVLQRPDFVFMDDYLAEGLLRLCVHLVKVRFCKGEYYSGFIVAHSAGVPVISLASLLLCIHFSSTDIRVVFIVAHSTGVPVISLVSLLLCIQ